MNFCSKMMYVLIYLYIIILPFSPENLKYKGMNIPQDLLLFSIIFIYLLNVIVSKKIREDFIDAISGIFRNSLTIFMLMLLFIMVISISYSQDKTIALNESLRFLTYIMLFWVISYGTDKRSILKKLLSFYILVSGVLGIFGIVQYFTGLGLNKKFIFDYKFGAKMRIAATLGNPNSYAAFLILIIFPIIILAIAEKNRNKRITYILLAVLLIINIVLTGSRNAILAFAIGCVVLSITYNWKLIYLLVVSIATSLFIPRVLERIKEIIDPTQNLSRIKLWGIALKMIKEHPISGIGNGNFVTLYDSYVKKYPDLEYPDYKHMPSHNSYLKVESELGIIGIISFLGILLSTIQKLIKLIKVEKDRFLSLFFMGFLASVISFLFMNLSDNLFFIPKVTSYFWLVIAIANSLLCNIKLQNQ